jgi:hypothetical protein
MKTPDTATYNLYSTAAAASFSEACREAGLAAEPEGAIVAVKVATRHDRDKADDLAGKDGDCVGYAFG